MFSLARIPIAGRMSTLHWSTIVFLPWQKVPRNMVNTMQKDVITIGFLIPACWMIHSAVSHCVDLMVDIATVGQCAHWQSVVTIRNILRMDTVDDNANKQQEEGC
jgi:hypothetical protein